MNIIDLIFPIKCLNCKKWGQYICKKCLREVPLSGWKKDNVYSVWRYKGVVRKAIISLKYKHATRIAKDLARYLIDELDRRNIIFSKNTIIIPIPLYWYKQNIRGFNQTEEIGKAVAKHFNCGFIPDLLVRKKHIKAQVELRGVERKENIKGVFEYNRLRKNKINKKNLLIIFDDVWTTGSTMKEAIRVLNSEGFNNVRGLTITN